MLKREASTAESCECLERRQDVLLPFRLRHVELHVEDSARDGVVGDAEVVLGVDERDARMSSHSARRACSSIVADTSKPLVGEIDSAALERRDERAVAAAVVVERELAVGRRRP